MGVPQTDGKVELLLRDCDNLWPKWRLGGEVLFLGGIVSRTHPRGDASEKMASNTSPEP